MSELSGVEMPVCPICKKEMELIRDTWGNGGGEEWDTVVWECGCDDRTLERLYKEIKKK